MADLRKYIPAFRPVNNLSFDFQFTVFIPVYNRAQTLHRIFSSLNSQTFKKFEVIIINDGSSDNTDEIIKAYLREATFEVTYINNVVNKHKLGCIIEAVKIARGEFFLILDSDDECTPDSLETFYAEYENIPENVKPTISGVTCCCIDQNNKLVGDYFPEDPFYSSSFEKKVYSQIKGEKWGFNKTSILKSIQIEEDVFSKGLIPESYLWFLISKQGFKTKYINKTLRTYYVESENSLSLLGYEKKAFGMAIFAISFMNWFHKEHFHKATKHFIMRLYSLLKASNYLKFTCKEYVKAIDNYLLKILLIILWPFRKIL